MLNIGDKVICIDDTKQPHTVIELNKDVPNWVKKGDKYTIRAICDFDFVSGVLLEEIENKVIYFRLIDKAVEPCFATWRFRKLKESEIEQEELVADLVF